MCLCRWLREQRPYINVCTWKVCWKTRILKAIHVFLVCRDGCRSTSGWSDLWTNSALIQCSSSPKNLNLIFVRMGNLWSSYWRIYHGDEHEYDTLMPIGSAHIYFNHLDRLPTTPVQTIPWMLSIKQHKHKNIFSCRSCFIVSNVGQSGGSEFRANTLQSSLPVWVLS